VLNWLIDETVVIVIILINTVALFMLASAELAEAQADLWFALDYACVVYFVVEAALKIISFGWRGYYDDGWNRMDFYVVVASLPVLATPMVDLRHFSVILILRMGRLFRMFRLLRFIPDRHRLAAGIKRSLKASLGVFLAVLLVNFILAMAASMLFGKFAPEYFGNPLKACYSMFQVFTVEGWYEIPELLAERASDAWAVFARAYFVFSVFFGGILGLSVVNAVFVDQMILDNNDNLEVRVDKLRDEIRDLRAEIRVAMRQRGAEASSERGTSD
jgi:voltage-gated sodium channel